MYVKAFYKTKGPSLNLNWIIRFGLYLLICQANTLKVGVSYQISNRKSSRSLTQALWQGMKHLHPFSSHFLGLWFQILDSIIHFKVSKRNKQYKWDNNFLDQKNNDFREGENVNVMPCVVKDGWIGGISK